MGYNTYDAIGAGFDGFLNSALQMVEFADRRAERQERTQMMQQRQVMEEQERRRQMQQTKFAADAYAVGSILNAEPGGYVSEDMRAVINRHYDKYPDFKNIERTETGVRIETEEDNPFTLPDGSTSTVLELTQEQLVDMKNRAMSLLDADGHAFLGKLADSYRDVAGEGVSPTERAQSINLLIKTSEELEKLHIDNDKPHEAAYEREKREKLLKQIENIIGVDYSTIETPAQRRALDDALGSYEAAKAKKWNDWKGTVTETEQAELDRKWALTGRPMREAPWRQTEAAPAEPAAASPAAASPRDPNAAPTREHLAQSAGLPSAAVPAPAAAQPAAPQIPEGYVLIETPDGQRGVIPAAQAEEYTRYGAKVVQ